MRRSHPARLPPPRRLQAQAAEPDEVPGQVARLGRRSAPSTTRELRRAARRRRRARCRSTADRPPVEEAPDVGERRAPSLGEIAARATTTAVIGPGIVPEVEPRLIAAVATSSRRWARDQRAAAEAGRLLDRHRHVPLGDLTSAQMRVLGELSQAYGDGTVRVTIDQNLRLPLGAQPATSQAFYERLAAAGLARRRGRHAVATSTSCPGAESCKLAVTQSRGLGRVLGDHLRDAPGPRRARSPGWTSRSAAARTAAASITSPASASRAACARSAAQPAPQYFVMVGGGVGDGITTFGRLAAKIPGPAVRARARAPGEALPGPARRPGIAAGVLPSRRARRRQGRCSPTSSACCRKRPSPRTSSTWPR